MSEKLPALAAQLLEELDSRRPKKSIVMLS